jgi:hypothetical protein
VVQNGPIRFFLFNKDINFSRQMHPIIIANIIFLLWFTIAALLRRKLLAKADISEERGLLVRVVDNLSGRVVNFADQIWRYQFLSVVWCCFIQFYSFEYPQGSNRSAAFNAIFCVSSFLCTLGWPIFTTFHCRKQYYEN